MRSVTAGITLLVGSTLLVGAFAFKPTPAKAEIQYPWCLRIYLGDGGDILQPLRLTESAHEASALHPRPPQQTPFGKNDGPGNHTEQQEQKQNDFSDRTGLVDEVDNLATHDFGKQW